MRQPNNVYMIHILVHTAIYIVLKILSALSAYIYTHIHTTVDGRVSARLFCVNSKLHWIQILVITHRQNECAL